MLRILTRNNLLSARTGFRCLSNSKILEDARQYKEGDSLHGYMVKQVESIPDFHMVAVKLEHEKTGAEHLHLARDDQNNVFREPVMIQLVKFLLGHPVQKNDRHNEQSGF